jgi:hypothetical protein
MMQKSTTFTTIFRVKKCYFHYDFACKKVPLSLRYAKKNFLQLNKNIPKVTNVRRLVVKQDWLIFRSVLAHHLLIVVYLTSLCVNWVFFGTHGPS